MTKIKANPDAELGVLGTLIMDGNPESLFVRKIMMQLDEKHFYDSNYRDLFKIIKKMFEEKQYFDSISLLNMSFDERITKIIDLSIIGNYFSEHMTTYHVEELITLHTLRNQLNIINKTSVSCLSEPISSLAIAIMNKGIKEAGNANLGFNQLGKTFVEIQKAYENNEYVSQSVIRCGIKQFEQVKNCSLITIAGGSGVGKTFFSIYVMDEIARYQPDKQILFFSLEMKENEIWERYILLRNYQFQQSSNLPHGKVFDMPRMDIEDIESLSHLEAMDKPVSVIVVDYLALVTSAKRFDRDDLRLSDITQRLAALAMELNCIVICLSQVNRDAAKDKDDPCPHPHHAADSVGSVRSSTLWIGIGKSKDDNSVFIAKCRKSRHGELFEAYFEFKDGVFRERAKPYVQKRKPKNFNEFIGDIE